MQKAEYFRKNRWMAGDLLGTYFSFADYAACYSFYMPVSFQDVSTSAVAGLVYVSLFSMLIGFFFWYKGLAQGGIAAISQLQLLQPLMGLAIAALLLHEHVSWSMLMVTAVTILCRCR